MMRKNKNTENHVIGYVYPCMKPASGIVHIKHLILALLTIFSFSNLFSQLPFQARYEGTADARVNVIVKSFSGGYLVGGRTSDPILVESRAKLLSIDYWGDTLWTKTLEIGQNSDVTDMVRLQDSTYLLLGGTSGSGTSQAFLMNLDDLGSIISAKSFGSSSSMYGTNISLTSIGDIMLLSGNNLIKMDANWDTLWTRSYSPLDVFGYLSLNKVLATSDDANLLIGSGSSGFMNNLGVIIKVDGNGDTLWTKSYGSWEVSFMDVAETSGGNYVVCGQSGFGPNEIGIIMMIDSMGNTIWNKEFSSNPMGGHNVQNVMMTEADEIIYGGTADYKLFVAKLDLNGDTIWTRYIDNNSSIERYNCTNGYDSTIVFCGTSIVNDPNAMYIAVINKNGDVGCGILNTETNVVSGNLPEASFPVNSTIGIPGFTSANLTYSIVADSTGIDLICMDEQEICVVSVDSVTEKNMIVWERLYDSTFVDYYNVYKETTVGGVFSLIGSIDISNDGVFVDTASIPIQNSDRYRISQVTLNGYEGMYSIIHKTIHLTINQGISDEINLIWEDYEGTSFGTYKIWRGNASGVQVIDSVPNSLNSYTDINPPVGDSIYFIETVLASACDPTLKSNIIGSSISNKVSLDIYSQTGIAEEGASANVFLYPNPANNLINIKGEGTINICNSIGQNIYSNRSDGLTSVEIETWQTGVYIVEIENKSGRYHLKFIK